MLQALPMQVRGFCSEMPGSQHTVRREGAVLTSHQINTTCLLWAVLLHTYIAHPAVSNCCNWRS